MTDPVEDLTGVPAQSLPRDAAHWAGTVSRLHADPASPAKGDNVTGRKLMGPVQGFGKMWQKTYTVDVGPDVTPQQAIAAWKADFGNFWPKGNRFHGALTGIAPGDVALLDLSLPGGVRLSTGVLVLYADDESFTLMTPQGHMFAGWITNSAFERDGTTIVQAQVLMRANDPLYELGLSFGGHGQEDRFWQQTLTALARHLGAAGSEPTVSLVCVDKRRQWRRGGNLWHNAAIRTVLQIPLTPVRAVTRRRRPAADPARR
ncbi:MAG: hypothetical protein M4D85_00360 [Actinomycetota bacterium]|nr:hypothetical protein [Actinomycetota bacterium]